MPSRDWKEVSPPGEAERFAEYARRFELLQEMRAKDGVRKRALHAKSHGGLRARLRVLGDLPDHARHGLFATPGEHRAYVRLSNGSGALQHDKAPDLRGLAVKVLDVPGPKVLGDASYGPGTIDVILQSAMPVGSDIPGGTITAPMVAAAYCSVTHSGTFVAQMATCSPF